MAMQYSLEMQLFLHCTRRLPASIEVPERERNRKVQFNIIQGVIHAAPEKATEMYSIMFEDSSYTAGYSPALPIHQRYVVSYRDPPDVRNR